MNTTLRMVIALIGILIGPISFASSTVAGRVNGIASQVDLKVLKPIASAALIPASEQNHYNPPPPEQYALAQGNTVYIRRGQSLVAIEGATGRVLWKRALPWLFTVWRGLLFTVSAQGTITAADAVTLEERWRLHVVPDSPAKFAGATPILRVFGGILVVSGFQITEFNPNDHQLSFGLAPESGKLIWKGGFWGLDTGYSTEANRFIVWFRKSENPLSVGLDPSVIDTRTGWQADFDSSVLHRTWSGREAVSIVYPELPKADQYPNTDAYTARVLIRADDPNHSLIQDLGLFSLGPRPDCYRRNLPFAFRGVNFLSANDDFVWLRVDDGCGNRIAQIARVGGLVRFIDLPEKLSLAERQRLSAQGQFTPTGRLNQQQRIEFLNEDPVLAKLRAELEPSKLLWSAAQGDKVYAVLKPNELRVLNADSGKLLKGFSLAIPEPTPLSSFELEVELMNRILVWRNASGAHFFFLL